MEEQSPDGGQVTGGVDNEKRVVQRKERNKERRRKEKKGQEVKERGDRKKA